MKIHHLIENYGSLYYAIIFAWTFLEGETVVLCSGIAAREGLVDLGTLIACAWIGSFLGDQMYFALGRRFGTRLLRRYPRWQSGTDRALGLLERYSTGFILTYRFIYGVRNFSSLAMGMSHLSWTRFAALNFVAAGLWSVAFAGGGYLAGTALQHMAGDLASGLGLTLLAGVVLGIGILTRVHRQRAVAVPAK
jgi:membrane protein DedA with SNARE-associated domain